MKTAAQTPDMSADNYYTTLEVAKILGMAVRSVQLMVDRGDLQAWKTPGGHRRITQASLDRWIQGSKVAGPVGAAPQRARAGRAGRARAVAKLPRILLIEDSLHFQNLVAHMVREKFPAVELHIASDGVSGLIAFGHLLPDLIIADIQLPDLDGAAAMAALRRHALFGGCKLIVSTALDETQRLPYAYALNDVLVVHKPQLAQELPGLIRSALGNLLLPAS